MYKLLISMLMLACVAGFAKDENKSMFGLTLGQPVPAEFKGKVKGKVLREVPAPDEKWDRYAVMVRRVGNDYVVWAIGAFKGYQSKEAGREAQTAIKKELKARFGTLPGGYAKVDEKMTVTVCLSFVPANNMLNLLIKERK